MGNTVTTNTDMVGKYINTYLWSDINPLGKIVGIKGKTQLILSRVNAERDESVNMDFVPGGFSAHCTNNHAQRWLYTVDESDTFTVRISKGFLKRNRIQDNPIHFYDFNF